MVRLAAGMVAITSTPARAVGALFVGGMFIHPLGVLLTKALGRSGTHPCSNSLRGLALKGTVIRLLGLPHAYAASQARMTWFFPAMLLVIGGRYITFATAVRPTGVLGLWCSTGGIGMAAGHDARAVRGRGIRRRRHRGRVRVLDPCSGAAPRSSMMCRMTFGAKNAAMARTVRSVTSRTVRRIPVTVAVQLSRLPSAGIPVSECGPE